MMTTDAQIWKLCLGQILATLRYIAASKKQEHGCTTKHAAAPKPQRSIPLNQIIHFVVTHKDFYSPN